jgi:hypothetical protein
MSLAPAKPRPHTRDFDHVLKALVHLLARQAARESVTSNTKDKEADHGDEEGTEEAAKAGEERPAG